MSGAEALLERHAEHKSEIDARYPTFLESLFISFLRYVFLVKFNVPFFSYRRCQYGISVIVGTGALGD